MHYESTFRFLYMPMEIFHGGHERLSDESRGKQDIFICLAALLCQQFLLIRERRQMVNVVLEKAFVLKV